MANIFNLSNDHTPDVNRNTFDLSFQNNFTAKFGYLYPVFCKEVLPGDTFKIRPTFALEMMPMVFPVQTRMRANLHFFYCRNRAAYKDFEDWIGNTDPDADPPYLDLAKNFENICASGSLGDHLGLPTTLIGEYGNEVKGTTSILCSKWNDRNVAYNSIQPVQSVGDQYGYYGLLYDKGSSLFTGLTSVPSDPTTWQVDQIGNGYLPLFYKWQFSSLPSLRTEEDWKFVLTERYETGAAGKLSTSGYRRGQILQFSIDSSSLEEQVVGIPFYGDLWGYEADTIAFDNKRFGVTIESDTSESSADFVIIKHTITVSKDGLLMENIRSLVKDAEFRVFITMLGRNVVPYLAPDAGSCYTNYDKLELVQQREGGFDPSFQPQSSLTFGDSDVVRDITPQTSPYYDSQNNPDGIKVNALPFRHYDAIYNTFYRDARNNPLMLNGKPEYNKVYVNTAGSADTTPYTLRRRNWESDFLTTAVQSPQQGAAPLVGITSTGKMTFQDEAGKQYQAQAEFADDGETITGFKVLSDDMPQANMRSLIDMSTTGISIADLRQVNSLQRWLEANMRKGLRYRDQMKAHFGIDIAYKELNMPEFIGGCSEDVRVNMVTQTTPTGDPEDPKSRPLGSYAGQASCVGTSNHDVDQYCDEYGYIIGIFSVTPVPNYSQLLPKHFIKRNIMDYFYPEFGNLGFVPIKYDEVCPIQAKNAGDDLNGTFGYQRAWYEYLASVDEVHGEFRKTLRDYLMNRTFDTKPELGEDFLLVDPAQLNEVFAVTTASDDKILGQIYFDCKVKRPIPLYGIPRLE